MKKALEHPLLASTRPAWKWPGGKYDLAPQLADLFPAPSTVTGIYREPFAGAAAMAFRWAAKAGLRIALSDTDAALVDTYVCLLADADGLVAAARRLCLPSAAPEDHEAHFYRLRDRYNTFGLGRLERAALFLYLHRACFNGLHRCDSSGKFNSSYGDLETAPQFDEVKIRNAATALARATVEQLDFEPAILRAEPGDFVYCDPPYDGTWVGYQAARFSSTAGTDACQFDLFTRVAERPALLRLRDCFLELDRRGIPWAMSNADTTEVRRLFGRWDVTVVKGHSSISRKASSRGERLELLVRSRAF